MIATLASNWIFRQPLTAVLVGILATSVLFQAFNYLAVGYLDSFFLIAMVMSSAYSSPVVIIVTFIIWIFRKKAKASEVK